MNCARTHNWQVDPKALDDEGRLYRDLMLRHLKDQPASLRWKTYEMPVNPHSGVHLNLVETVSVTPFDYASDLEGLHGLPKFLAG